MWHHTRAGRPGADAVDASDSAESHLRRGLVGFVMVAALMAASIIRLFAAVWGELVQAHGAVVLAAPLAAAAATAVAGIFVRARHAYRRAEIRENQRCAAASSALGTGPLRAVAPLMPRCFR